MLKLVKYIQEHSIPLYIGLNNNGIIDSIFKLSTKQLLTTMKYHSVSVSENLFKIINEKDSFTTKIHIDWFDSDRFVIQDDCFVDTEDDGQTWSNKVDNSEDRCHDEVDSPYQLDCMHNIPPRE